eukprot:CAMPEP_0179336842 /NCGR_PEP_ID=MMETSP0797-20121207/67272_1 /TAXON_ID=47934 /ORGANISM="Dinophysis acuminata, Strain DAEP01" /LENGTH=81 /DNA_ID=CAMNT_0021050383 /DNA_START=39 /DNA_END=282 /DNA_ORIENTATION=-
MTCLCPEPPTPVGASASTNSCAPLNRLRGSRRTPQWGVWWKLPRALCAAAEAVEAVNPAPPVVDWFHHGFFPRRDTCGHPA